MNGEMAESIIQEYQEECLFPPKHSWPECEFSVRSYSRWASNEILHRLKKRPLMAVENIIQEFIEELDHCIEITDNWSVVVSFRVAKSTAKDILEIFL